MEETITSVDEALRALAEITDADPESGHAQADWILTELIRHHIEGGEEVVRAWEAIQKWYA